MPRPKKCRRVEDSPRVHYFKPRGVPLRELTEVYLTVEGYEALRLADLLGLSQEEAAARMNVSRHTFGRVLAQARKAVAQTVVEGYALRIEGGDYEVAAGTDGDNGRDEQTGPRNPKERMNVKKIAISADGPGLDDMVDPRFGRAGGFVIVDLDSLATSWMDNGSSQIRAQGAGIAAAEMMAKAGVGVVLTGYVGPKAFTALSAAGISVGQDLENMTVRQALQMFRDDKVRMADAPNREGR